MLESESAEPAGPKPPSVSKHVSDFVPFEKAAPVEASWNEPPPVRSAGVRPARPPLAPDPAAKKIAPQYGRRGKESVPTPKHPSPPAVVVPPEVLEEDDVPATAREGAGSGEPAPTLTEGAMDPPPAESVELPAGAWEVDAPPVRFGGDAAASSPEDDAEAVPAEASASTKGQRRKRNFWTGVGLVAGVFIALGALAFAAVTLFRQSEGERATAAYTNFNNSRYSNAAEDFKELQKTYASTSQRLDEYHSMEELSAVVAAVTSTSGSDDVGKLLDQVGSFAKSHKSDAAVRDHANALGKATANLVTNVIKAEQAKPSEETPARLKKVQFVIDRVGELGSAVFQPGLNVQWQTEIVEANEIFQKWARRRGAHDQIYAYLTADGVPPVEIIKVARDLLRRYEIEFPGIGAEPDIVAALDAVYKRHAASSGVFDDSGGEPGKPAAADIPYPSFFFGPRLDQRTAAVPAVDPVVLSLVRGVLYGHSSATGEVRWIVRVGVDTTTLPIRVPETASSPERILVLLADSETLSALDPDGNEVWRYHMGSPCLGRPVVVDKSVLLPTYDGQVHEVELARGRPIGHWQLGQPLSGYGVLEVHKQIDGNKKIVYFPAESMCVYALNVDPAHRGLEAILYSNHSAGSLRGAPIVIPRTEKAVAGQGAQELPAFLILNQTDGLEGTEMRVFPLPMSERTGPPIRLDPSPRLRGWTWFTPYQDSEKVAAVTDAGVFGLFGVKQAGNSDGALFPLLPVPGLDDLLKPEGNTRVRAQIVHAQGDDYWVLSRGKLLRLAKTWNAAEGPKLVSGWNAPLELGSPLHESQVQPGRSAGPRSLFVVTQALKQKVSLATAVRDEDGEKLWQRQVGVVCQGPPVLLGNKAPAGTAPVIVVLGQGGELFVIDPLPFKEKQNGAPWLSAARTRLAEPVDNDPARPPVLLAGPDGLTAYEVAFPGAGNRMIVRSVTFDPTTRKTKKEEQEIKLPRNTSPVGNVEIVGNSLVVSLSNGVAYWLPVAPLAADGKEGSNWRSVRLGSDVRGYLAALSPTSFVSTDGGNGLTFWKLGADLMDRLFPAGPGGDEEVGVELDDRIVAAPLVVSQPGATSHFVVADAHNLLRRIKVTATAAQEEKDFQWNLGGRLTAGPFLRTTPGALSRVGCVVEGTRLVWIDPRKGREVLEYRTAGAAIVGEPQLVGGKLIVADQEGHIVALDPATLKPVGKGYVLPGSVAPAAAPVLFDDKTLFTPLTDGTVLLLEMQLFQP
jgi:outer membrane protein assembly factor BamB